MNNNKTRNLQSDIIRFLRFPLILGVLYRHAQASNIIVQGQDLALNQNFYFLDLCQRLFCDTFGNIRMPLFFFISGLLFFRNYTESSVGFYKKQWRKRFDSLLLPYLFWNASLILIYLIAQQTPGLSGLFSGRSTPVLAYGWRDLLDAFGITSYRPVSLQFWFVRDLIVASVLAPVIAFLVRKTAFLPVMIFYLLRIIRPEWHTEGICFFSMGAYFSLYSIDILEFSRKYSIVINTLFITYTVIYVFVPQSSIGTDFIYMSIPLGVFAVFDGCRRLLSRYKVSNIWFQLSDMSFFLFAIHELLLSFLKKILYLIFTPRHEAMLILFFLLPPLLVTLFAWYSYQHLIPLLPNYIKKAMGIRPSPVSTLNREVVEKSPILSTPS